MITRLGQALRAWLPSRSRLLPPTEHERVLAPARIETLGGLTALYLGGTPYEMGYQHGVLARDRILGFREAAYSYVANLLPVPKRLARPVLFHQAAAYWPLIPEDLAQEMMGIADGAGVHPIEVLVSTAIWEMYLVSGCSEFAAVGPATVDGALLHGYNYDLMHPDHALIQPYLAALFYQPQRGLPFVTVNTVGSVGANAGMNRAGVSVAWDNTYLCDDSLGQDMSGLAIPFIITLRRLLQGSHSLAEAVQTVVATLPRPLGDIVIVGSASEGQAIALETAGHLHAVRPMEEHSVWSTNCFRSPALAIHDRRGEGHSLSDGDAWRRFPRYAAYHRLFSAHRGRLDTATAAAFLRDPFPREALGYLHPVSAPGTTICRAQTSWSTIMAPGEGRLWISDTALPGCQGTFFAFDLPARQRLPELDLPPSGYHAALQCADHYLAGDGHAAGQALAEAIRAAGPTAPLLLMQALLQGQAGQDDLADASLRQITARWPGTPLNALALAWLGESDGTARQVVPFPSAIQPRIHLRNADGWDDRAVTSRA